MPLAIFPRSSPIAKGLLALLAVVPAAEARADRISLRGGGEIKGKVVPDPARKGMVQLIGFQGKPLEFRREQIARVVPEPSVLDEYATLRAQPRTTPQEEYDLGVWCEEHKLADLARAHFEEVIRQDGEFGQARAKLGHVFSDGRWLDHDAQRMAEGLVKYQGHWLTVEEKEKREAQAAFSTEARSWSKRIGKMLDTYRRGPEDRSRDAEAALLAIREVAAVGPIARGLGNDPEPEVRGLAARVLGEIPGPEASRALVSRLLAEADEPTRRAIMAELARREPDEVLPGLARALQSNQTEVINRAAWALAGLNAVALVPRLVPALISVEYQTVMVPDPTVGSGPAPSGFYVGGGPSIPITTPAVVGSGSVAFGASSIPASALGGFGVNLGGGGVGGPRPMLPKLVPYERRNVEVLSALVKLTGQDFGYNIPGWKRWVATSFRNPAAVADRHVPQP
ncbi:HEAT repeat domain-containing protein [Tundrisphaera sp. TA3]|uniref:HEAT repeat domain-containing protein n=1 Tax=Tundrisphaera sp. TA3 TaxID=3435775 RepID=UPI003EBC2BB9